MNYMKKTNLILIAVLASLILVCGCSSRRLVNYYSNQSNYIETTTEITGIYFYKDIEKLMLVINTDGTEYSDSHLVLRGKNAESVVEQGGLELLAIGSQVTFTAAPKYFGDGYEVPIVALYAENKNLLLFEDGYRNLINELKEGSAVSGNQDNPANEDQLTDEKYNRFYDLNVTVTGIEYNDRIGALLFSFDSSEYDYRITDYIPFISGNDLEIALSNNILENVKIGNQMLITVAPVSMKHDVFIPVTLISFQGNTILDKSIN